MTTEERAFPIQAHRLGKEQAKVSEAVYMAAYEVYSHVHGVQPALIDLAGRNCRGGFSIGELVAFLYARPFPKAEWRDRVNEAYEGLKGMR